jgi:hypothetical protein
MWWKRVWKLFQPMPLKNKELHTKAMKKKDFKAMFFIHQCDGLINFQKIENATTTKECWEILEKGHAGNEKLKQVRLQILKR